MRHWRISYLEWRAGRLLAKADKATRDALTTAREWRAEAARLQEMAEKLKGPRR